jgi:hypothetical protein
MILKIISVLVSGRRRIQSKHKDIVKVTVKFIRRGIVGRKEKEKHFLFPNTGNGSKDSTREVFNSCKCGP